MFQALAIFKDTNGLFIGDVSGAMHVCLAGEACGGTLLSNKSGGGSRTPYSHGVAGYFGLYGTGQFDGQSSGHDFYGTIYMPPTGFVNNCDGGRSHTYCDYRQQ
ncbi:hypothetical protein GUITHDRAFT_156237 [Guillardia theta CCMP2712]|uniref:Uncharacterized protein n=1 Tax=Guillardia theta (strain CCMP2712) TaxID=905079 RepID=L1IAD1_GUITC|nr:hypothetical protein GUITHDRAFT_156237 [Guillardia theta CCMP2712]EKX32775.1 hypothetical protein GUITHDRAFT_156237 [Guillardia theta CCMP2712]|mmetsp:Transcript_5394/g.19015  ORF Transcript_5394/g.19015 Transcript_5394/m.19015 type:complete len:104 (-) Transcript_5394:1254-1565(-)|eukprot:XP_005819755.1 hypothetical protein GUITHDRAFT_156237 [Guillardia theta CCMP2712]